MEKFRIYAYDIWGNKIDGYYVNNVIKTDFMVELSEDMTDRQIIRALKDCGFLFGKFWYKSFQINGEYDLTLYIDDIRESVGGNCPFCELRRVDVA